MEIIESRISEQADSVCRNAERLYAMYQKALATGGDRVIILNTLEDINLRLKRAADCMETLAKWAEQASRFSEQTQKGSFM